MENAPILRIVFNEKCKRVFHFPHLIISLKEQKNQEPKVGMHAFAEIYNAARQKVKVE